MSDLRFDERELQARLKQLPNKLRVAFAAACAERQLPNYANFSRATGVGDPIRLAGALGRVWDDIEGRTVTDNELQKQLDTCMSLLPDDEVEVQGQAYANDAVASVAYAIRARLTGDCQEAVWAARRAYEALDYYIVSRFNPKIVEPDAEARIVAHPLVQAELRRQRTDFSQLQEVAMNSVTEREAIVDLRNRSKTDAALFFDPKI
jgi:uncharacterized protein YjaG (DUF416 family)